MSDRRSKWEARFQELKDFKEEHGHCDVPERRPGGLGRWLRTQRKARKKGIKCLDAARIQQLDEVGFKWGIHEDKWDSRLRELTDFKEKNGHCDVPTNHPGGLGRWVEYQRGARNRAGWRRMDPSRIQMLEDAGITWQVKVMVTQWDARFADLKRFKAEHGHCDVPVKHPGGLGRWLATQRRDGVRRLGPDRVRRLETEGFKWKVACGEDIRWDARFEQLKDFKEQHGHCNVPVRHPGGLGRWVIAMRSTGKEKMQRLHACRVQKLEDEGFKWQIRQSKRQATVSTELNNKEKDVKTIELEERAANGGGGDVGQSGCDEEGDAHSALVEGAQAPGKRAQEPARDGQARRGIPGRGSSEKGGAARRADGRRGGAGGGLQETTESIAQADGGPDERVTRIQETIGGGVRGGKLAAEGAEKGIFVL